MANGSFSGLYTFEQVAGIYNIDPSTIRKQVQGGKFETNKEIKKFGKTWIMTEKAMIEHFGQQLLTAYKQDLAYQELCEKRALRASRTSSKKSKSDSLLMDGDDFKEVNTWGEVKVNEALVTSSFSFSNSKGE